MVNSFDIYSQETQMIHIGNMKVCIDGIWVRIKNSRQALKACRERQKIACMNHGYEKLVK